MARNYRVEKQTTRKGMVWEITLKQPKSTEEVAQQLEQESDDDELCVAGASSYRAASEPYVCALSPLANGGIPHTAESGARRW